MYSKKGMEKTELPSHYLNRVKEVLGRKNFDLLVENNPKFAQELFLNEMPTQVQMSLYSLAQDNDINKLVVVADDLFKNFVHKNFQPMPQYGRDPPYWGCLLYTSD